MKPSVEEAVQHRNNVRVTEKDSGGSHTLYPLSTSVLEDETAVLGSGVQLYLKFLKFFSLVFMVMFVLNLPLLILSSSGQALEEDTSTTGSALLVWPSLANLAVYNLTAGGNHGTRYWYFNNGAWKVDAGSASVALPLIDTFSGFVFVMAAWYLSRRQLKQVEALDEAQLTCQDYSVCIKGFPLDTTEEQVQCYSATELPRSGGCLTLAVFIGATGDVPIWTSRTYHHGYIQ